MGSGHLTRIVSTLAATVDQTAPEEPLVHVSGTSIRIMCPWCETWEPPEAFIELQTPPKYPVQCGTVLKHRCPGARSGRGRIFSIRNYNRPAKAVEA